MFPAILGLGSMLLGGIGSIFGNTSSSKSDKTTNSTTNSQDTKVAQTGTQDLADPLLQNLQNLFQSVLGSGTFTQGQTALSNRLDSVSQAAAQPAFDVNSFVNGIMSGARAKTQGDLENNVNTLASSTGTSANDNSMTALLTNRMKNDANASLASTEAQTRATGEQIATAQQAGYTDQINQLSNSLSGQILSLIEQTRGAQGATTQTGNDTSMSTSIDKSTEIKKTTDSTNPFSAFANMFSVLGKSAQAA